MEKHAYLLVVDASIDRVNPNNAVIYEVQSLIGSVIGPAGKYSMSKLKLIYEAVLSQLLPHQTFLCDTTFFRLQGTGTAKKQHSIYLEGAEGGNLSEQPATYHSTVRLSQDSPLSENKVIQRMLMHHLVPELNLSPSFFLVTQENFSGWFNSLNFQSFLIDAYDGRANKFVLKAAGGTLGEQNSFIPVANIGLTNPNVLREKIDFLMTRDPDRGKYPFILELGINYSLHSPTTLVERLALYVEYNDDFTLSALEAVHTDTYLLQGGYLDSHQDMLGWQAHITPEFEVFKQGCAPVTALPAAQVDHLKAKLHLFFTRLGVLKKNPEGSLQELFTDQSLQAIHSPSRINRQSVHNLREVMARLLKPSFALKIAKQYPSRKSHRPLDVWVTVERTMMLVIINGNDKGNQPAISKELKRILVNFKVMRNQYFLESPTFNAQTCMQAKAELLPWIHLFMKECRYYSEYGQEAISLLNSTEGVKIKKAMIRTLAKRNKVYQNRHVIHDFTNYDMVNFLAVKLNKKLISYPLSKIPHLTADDVLKAVQSTYPTEGEHSRSFCCVS